MKTDLSGRVAIVTGGTRGIGRAIALKLASCDAQVVICGRDASAAAEVANATSPAAPPIVFIPGDINDHGQMGRLVAETIARFGRVDILVANGGSRHPGPALFDEVRADDLRGYFDGRVMSRLYPFHAALPHMKERRYGKVVLITSDAGRVPTPSEAMIGAAGAALMFLTRAIGREVARWGVRVNTVSTTLTTDTPAWETYKEKAAAEPNAVIVKAFKRIEELSPFGLNEPEDIANLVLFLVAPESDQISGATISINGGLAFP